MTKREIEITLELERIKKEEGEDSLLKETEAPANRTKNGKKGKQKGAGKVSSDKALLAPKEPNPRERKREMEREQKRIEKKRKTDTKMKAPLPKKIKREPGFSCIVCEERFCKLTVRDAHMGEMHWPKVFEFGCSSCQEQFTTLEENIAHNEWHFKSKTPYKCVLCNATFLKTHTFMTHQNDCSYASSASSESFACSIYCGLCNLEFETQNLYDWHSRFISDNSSCPQCAKIFTKRTVLFKHMFKCDGPSNAVTPVQPKKGKAKAKKKTAKGGQKVKNSSGTNSLNNVKFEPEGIIEPNMDDDDAFDSIDNSYMDTHFADSDNEFEPNNSIIPSTDEIHPTTGSDPKQNDDDPTISANISEGSASDVSNVRIRSTLRHQLLECRVKLEPLDVSSMTSSIVLNSTPPSVPETQQQQQQLTVPPLTIRIKKEVIRHGYGDEFDINVAHSIKQERVDETYELAGTSTATSTNQANQANRKKSKNHIKLKKLYKKLALLAIKIKQERMERESIDDEEFNDNYQDYEMPSDDYNMGMINQSLESNPLPIITQIHSIIGPGSVIPMANEQSTNQIPIVSRLTDISQNKNDVPFMPIRIKSEFQRPLSPPSLSLPAIQAVVSQQQSEQTSESTSAEAQTIENVENSACMTEIVIPRTANEDDQEEFKPESSFSVTSGADGTSDDLPRFECDKDSNLNGTNDRRSSSMNEDDQTLESTIPSENNSEHSKPILNSGGNSGDTEGPPQNQLLSEVYETRVKVISNESEIVVDDSNSITNPIEHKSENGTTVDSTSEYSMNSLDKQLELLPTDNEEVAPQSDEMLQSVQRICDDANNVMDTDVTNDASNILIDFIEPSTNDDSLNFIDELDHEVAKTIVSQTVEGSEKDENPNGEIPIDASHLPIDRVDLDHNDADESAQTFNTDDSKNESTIKVVDTLNEASVVLGAVESQSNGSSGNKLDSNPETDNNQAPSGDTADCASEDAIQTNLSNSFSSVQTK